jgi:hypothetical protein
MTCRVAADAGAGWRDPCKPAHARAAATHLQLGLVHDVNHHWQHKGRRLAAARLCNAEHVAPAERRGQRLRLDRRGLLVASLGDGGCQGGVEAAVHKELDGFGGIKAAHTHAQLAAVVGHLRAGGGWH